MSVYRAPPKGEFVYLVSFSSTLIKCSFYLCRAGRSAGQKVISREYTQRAPRSTIPSVTRAERATYSQTRLGYYQWESELNNLRSFSTQIQSESEATLEEGKTAEGADENADELDINTAVEGAVLGTSTGHAVWDQEWVKSQQALWKKIEGVKKGPQKSVVPLIQEWLNEGHALEKRVLVTLLIRLRRRQWYKQAMEVIPMCKSLFSDCSLSTLRMLSPCYGCRYLIGCHKRRVSSGSRETTSCESISRQR